MALGIFDRVRETTSVTSTGTATLLGVATGYQSFAVVGNGNTTYYCIAGQGTSEWEVGIGTYTASGTTLTRTTVIESSNSNTLVNFSAGTKDVFVTYPGTKGVYLDASGNTVMPYPGAGLVVSTGTAWGTSKTSPSGTIVGTTDTQTLTGKTLRAYTESVNTIGTISTATYNIDLSLANIFDLTLGINTTVTFTNAPASGTTRPITLIVRQPAASPGKTLTVTGAKYTDATAPILSTGVNQIDVLSYWSIDGGTNYFGTYAMANVS
jgi:hypothetical protein